MRDGLLPTTPSGALWLFSLMMIVCGCFVATMKYDRLASFYAENGSLAVNAGPPSVGRAAIAATAQGFMTAFPDMIVKMDQVSQEGGHVIFRWTWTGTNAGPGGTGKFVRLTGYEEWTIGTGGLIAASKGHYDEAEYQRQVTFGAPST